jgi:Icc-related predicted phosphoesterase
MRILLLADIESKYYYDFFEKSKLNDIDLIISAGDLEADYLSFLATYAKCPVLYVKGNHDGRYDEKPPEGCICIDDTIYVHEGIRIMGLGGSMLYNGSGCQFTEKDMQYRILKMKPKLLMKKGIDILVTHAPAYGLNDGDDLPHMGFKCFKKLLEKYSPKYYIHGHVHMTYGRSYKRVDTYKDTTVVNAYERYILEY